MLEENLARYYLKIEAMDFFLIFLFCFQSLKRNEFLIVLVVFLLK